MEYNQQALNRIIIACEPMETNNYNLGNLEKLEALLFVSSGLVSVYQLSQVFDMTESEVDALLADLEEHYKMGGHGLRLMRVKSRVQLTTAPHLSETIERFLGLEARSTLSQAALEALAIVAYKQPVTRPEVDAVRGVNSDAVLRTLLSKGLIEELGRAETPGRPILYGTTPEFLQHFGLTSLEALPYIDFDSLENDINHHQSKEVLKS